MLLELYLTHNHVAFHEELVHLTLKLPPAFKSALTLWLHVLVPYLQALHYLNDNKRHLCVVISV